MKVINTIDDSKKFGVTIGNFDGVHRGHQAFLKGIKKQCKDRDLAFCVVTFVPHPHQILFPQDDFLVNTYLERRTLLKEIGVEYLLEIEFTRDLSTLEPGEFLDRYVIRAGNNVDVFYAGYDFAFGAQKKGGHLFLQGYCKAKSIEHILCEQFMLDHELVSSSTVRENIKRGEMNVATELLGREFFISGTVVRGESRGKQMGFPTINIKYSKQVVIPMPGVYATKLYHKGDQYYAITNVGNNPTFGSGRKTTIETFVFDFDDTIYGDDVEVSFVEKIRNEERFSGPDELCLQIDNDIKKVRKIHQI